MLRRKVVRRDAIDMRTRVNDAPEVLTIPLILRLTNPEKTHPGTVAKASVLLLMKRFDRAPQRPSALVLVLVKKLKMQIDD